MLIFMIGTPLKIKFSLITYEVAAPQAEVNSHYKEQQISVPAFTFKVVRYFIYVAAKAATYQLIYLVETRGAIC